MSMSSDSSQQRKVAIITSVTALVLSAVFCLAAWTDGGHLAALSLIPVASAMNQAHANHFLTIIEVKSELKNRMEEW